MSDPFSHPPVKSKSEKEEPKPVLGESFSHWVEAGFKAKKKREARPLLRLVALMVIIVCLAWGAQKPGDFKSALLGPEHPRTLLPIAIVPGETPAWNEENLRDVIETVQPRARKCLEGWSDMSMNDDGMVVVEVVLDPTGPDEAAIYDQTTSVPQPIQDCLGSALGGVMWPLPNEQQSVHFPIIGGRR